MRVYTRIGEIVRLCVQNVKKGSNIKVFRPHNHPHKQLRKWVVLRKMDWKGTRMREKFIERKLVEAVRAMEGIAPKLIAPGMSGMPDRIVLLPGGKLAFVEVKAPGAQSRPLQQRRHEQLRQLGFQIFVLDGPEMIGGMLDAIQSP